MFSFDSFIQTQRVKISGRHNEILNTSAFCSKHIPQYVGILQLPFLSLVLRLLPLGIITVSSWAVFPPHIMQMSSSGSIKTICYDWVSWTVKGIDFHLPPIKSWDIWHAFSTTFQAPPFCFPLKYSAVPLASLLLLVRCQNIFILICLFNSRMCVYTQ